MSEISQVHNYCSYIVLNIVYSFFNEVLYTTNWIKNATISNQALYTYLIQVKHAYGMFHLI